MATVEHKTLNHILFKFNLNQWQKLISMHGGLITQNIATDSEGLP